MPFDASAASRRRGLGPAAAALIATTARAWGRKRAPAGAGASAGVAS